MKVALYARVSTERQAERGTIGSQLAVLREHVSAEGHEVAGEYIDDGHSGARLDRPGLDTLRDAAEAGLFEAVWCLSPDRLARAYAYQVLILDELARFGIKVHFSDAPDLAADDPQAVLLTQVQGVIAEYEKAKIAERYRRGKLFRARAGEITTWKAPTATGASPAARQLARRTWRSTNPKPRSCAASSPTASAARRSVRSVATSTPRPCPHRPAGRLGATPP
jgi:site-specific DNA recombinase